MYSITRTDAADMLGVSTRSLDRYVKAGKIRAKKIGKIVYLNSDDVNNMLGKGKKIHKVISPNDSNYIQNRQVKNDSSNSNIVKKTDYDKITASFENIFYGLREELSKKDDKIQDLSIKLGRSEEIIKNSVNIVEHKKSQFLLEESKIYLNNEINDVKSVNSKLSEELKYEKTTNKLLIAFVILLLAVTVIIWFVKI